MNINIKNEIFDFIKFNTLNGNIYNDKKYLLYIKGNTPNALISR